MSLSHKELAGIQHTSAGVQLGFCMPQFHEINTKQPALPTFDRKKGQFSTYLIMSLFIVIIILVKHFSAYHMTSLANSRILSHL